MYEMHRLIHEVTFFELAFAIGAAHGILLFHKFIGIISQKFTAFRIGTDVIVLKFFRSFFCRLYAVVLASQVEGGYAHDETDHGKYRDNVIHGRPHNYGQRAASEGEYKACTTQQPQLFLAFPHLYVSVVVVVPDLFKMGDFGSLWVCLLIIGNTGYSFSIIFKNLHIVQ